MRAHHLALLLTGALLLALLGLGLRLQLGWGRGRARWPHHALFFAVCLGTALSMLLAVRAGQAGWALLPALALLLSMPATRPGQGNHWRRALLCAAAFALGAGVTWG
ncbi:hypothetical protein [Deinococcus aquaedulcis]|uniref:hypothetical protein n=1 Tax=Deinococcus aquaedulcis TaxID=2840455 RepID=UPI001C83EAF1|nr:hypothetical protein [Deinococcus aquaedulcis]